MDSDEIICTSVVERTSGSAPRFATIPEAQLGEWSVRNILAVEGTMNGYELGRTSLRKQSTGDRYEIELPSALCAKAQVSTGDRVQLHLRLAEDIFPAELQQLLDTDEIARTAWSALSEIEKRAVRERVTSGRLSETRASRARDALI